MLKGSSFYGGILGGFFASLRMTEPIEFSPLEGEKEFVSKQRRAYKFKRGEKLDSESINVDLNPSPVLQTPSPRCGEGRGFGFTLAEVLITLGIIGVVAALTLPTLISNYKKQTYVTGLQKAYSVLNNVTKDAMAKEDVTNFTDTQLMKAWTSDANEFAEILKSFYPSSKGFFVLESLSKTYSREELRKVDSNYHLSGLPINANYWYCMINQDSIMYCFAIQTNYPQSFGDYDFGTPLGSWQHNNVLVDINGFKKPNQLGRDIFLFAVGGYSGKIVPAGSKVINDDYASHMCKNLPSEYQASCISGYEHDYIGRTQANDYCFNTEAQKKPEGVNLYCADKIIKEGWKMNY